jgi:methylase of polypeptide subunit release factors
MAKSRRKSTSTDNRTRRDTAALSGVRAALDRAGYTRDAVRAALKTDQHLTAQPGEVVIFERRVTGRSPLETLIRLFLIGQTVQPEDAASLAPHPLEELERGGLVERTDRGLRATVKLAPHGDILIACDRFYYGDSDTHEADLVTGVSSPAILLADLTVRRAARSALDLGTGGGIQALLLAKHCERVVAVDVNPRALDYARLNAALNGIENIDPRLGSWFEPVAGERFDIITANPPYVMSPDSTFLYRDSGMPADSLCRQLVREIPDHLEEGAFGHILVSWAQRSGEEWSAPLRRWITGLPCDVWLLHYLTEDPLTQAGKWNQPLVHDGMAAYGSAIDRWVDYYRREGIDQIAFGAVILRKRSGGSNWVRADSFQAGRGSSAGLLLRVFEAEDYLRALSDDRPLMDERFALVPEHRLEQKLRADGGAWQLEDGTLTLTQGISFHGSLDMGAAQLLQHLDGRRSLREAVAEASRELELSSTEADALAATGTAMARRLYQLGFLTRGKASKRKRVSR